MKKILSSIIKFLTTFFICFSLLSIHVEKLPEGDYSVSYSSVQAEEGGSGMMGMITMLVVGVVTWRLTDMCAKTAPDILIAAAAGAIYIAGEATAILGHKSDSEKESENYSAKSGGDNENAQTDAFKSQKSQAESTKSTGETKLMLQAAAAVAFGIAAVTAFTSATLLDTEVAACMSTTTASFVKNGAASTATLALSASTKTSDASIIHTLDLIGAAKITCGSSSKTCITLGAAKIKAGMATTPYGSALIALGGNLEADGGFLATATTALGVAFTSEEANVEPMIELLRAEKATVALQATAIEAAEEASVAASMIAKALKATEPSKVITAQKTTEVGVYTNALLGETVALAFAKVEYVDMLALISGMIGGNAGAITSLGTAFTEAGLAATCSAGMTCLGAVESAQFSALTTKSNLANTLSLAKKAAGLNTLAVEGALAAKTACTTLSATLEIQIAMCEPGITSAFGSHKSPYQIGDAAKTCSVDSVPSESDKFINDLLSAPVKTYKDIDKIALEKSQSADDPINLFSKVLNIAMDSILPSAKAGLMDMLGLAGPAIGIFAAMKTTTAFEYDYLLASPGNRAMIWTGLGAVTAFATMQTNDQIAEKEDEIAELDQIIEKLENLDKDAQDIAALRNSENGKNTGDVRRLGGEFNSRKNGKPSVNDRLAAAGSDLDDNKFSEDGFPCVKTDKNGKCYKFAGNLSVTGDKGLDKVSESVGGLADSLNGSTNLDGKSRLLSSSIVKGKSAVDKALSEKMKKYNLLRKSQGKKPIDFKRLGGEFFTKLRGQTAAAAKKQGFSGGAVANGFNSKAARDARAALLKAQRYKYKRRKGVSYKSKGLGLNKAKRANYGRQKSITSYGSGDSEGREVDPSIVKNAAILRDEAANEISEDNGVSIFGIISNRYNVLKVRRRFGR